MLKQLAVFVENQPGSLRKVTTALHEQKLTIYAFTSYDTPEFGIMRVVVDNPQKAKEQLTSMGFVTRVCDVIAIELPDEAGGMDVVLESLLDSNININYTYSSFGRATMKPAVVIHTDDIYETEQILQRKGFTCIDTLA